MALVFAGRSKVPGLRVTTHGEVDGQQDLLSRDAGGEIRGRPPIPRKRQRQGRPGASPASPAGNPEPSTDSLLRESCIVTKVPLRMEGAKVPRTGERGKQLQSLQESGGRSGLGATPPARIRLAPLGSSSTTSRSSPRRRSGRDSIVEALLWLGRYDTMEEKANHKFKSQSRLKHGLPPDHIASASVADFNRAHHPQHLTPT